MVLYGSGCTLLNDFDLRLNQPLLAERISGEVLYRQIRDVPLTPFSVPDAFFHIENTLANTAQAWNSHLYASEAAAIAGFVHREARWMDLDMNDPFSTLLQMGEAQMERIRGLENDLFTAIGKSVTHGMVVRHYVRSLPSAAPGEPQMMGRMYSLRNFLSCSLTDRSRPGYGACELRIYVPPGAGRGVFVSPPHVQLSDAEFVLPPGTTLRICGVHRGVMYAERVRPLGRSWGSSRPAILGDGDSGKNIAANDELLERFRKNIPEGRLPAIAPPPMFGLL